jgi:hypothetical protein
VEMWRQTTSCYHCGVVEEGGTILHRVASIGSQHSGREGLG